jgi:hypothetical protein
MSEMQDNPYAPPVAAVQIAEPAAIEWSFADAWRVATRLVVKHWGVVVFASVAVFAAKNALTEASALLFPATGSQAPAIAQLAKNKDFAALARLMADQGVRMAAVSLPLTFLHASLEAVLVKLYQSALRDEPFSLATGLRGFPLIVSCGLTMVLVLSASLFGTLLCVVPGIVAFVALNWASYFAADQELNPIESLQESWRIAMGPSGWRLALGFVGLLVGVGVATVGGRIAVAAATIIADVVGNVLYALAAGRVAAREA